MAEFNYVSLGQAASDAEHIKGMRQRNRMAGIELQQQEEILKNRAEAKKIRQMYDSMPQQIEKLEEHGLFDQADQMRDAYLRQQVNTIKVWEQMRGHVNADNYDRFRQDMIQSGAIEPDMAPVNYSDSYFAKEIERQKGDLKKLTRTWMDQGTVLSQDLVQQDGEIVWSGTPYEASNDKTARTGGGGKEFSMDSSDSNSIRASAAELFGGFYDPQTGKINGLDRDTAQRVASITERAANIYNANKGRIPHAEAVARAARESGINIQDLRPDSNNFDPLGWGAKPPR